MRKMLEKYFNVDDHLRTTTHIINNVQTEYIFYYYRLVFSLFYSIRDESISFHLTCPYQPEGKIKDKQSHVGCMLANHRYVTPLKY